jgi:hypothetical protein
VRVRLPLSAPLYRGVVKLGNTAASKPAGRHCPCRCNSGRRDQSCGRAWNRRPGGLKNRCAFWRVGVQLASAAPIFSASGGVDTRESQKLVGESPCRCKSCLADQFDASSSNESRRPASQAGNTGASPSASTTLHPTRRKRRTVLVRQTAGRTSLWMLQFLRMWRNSIRAGARIR